MLVENNSKFVFKNFWGNFFDLISILWWAKNMTLPFIFNISFYP